MLMGKKNRPALLCSDPEHDTDCKIKEWFDCISNGRMRAKALNSFGYFIESPKSCQGVTWYYYSCFEEECSAKVTLREVVPDNNGNKFGLYGCIFHNHDLVLTNKIELIFNDYETALNFFNQSLEWIYTRHHKRNRNSKKTESANYSRYLCRRNNLKKGQENCESKLTISKSFQKNDFVDNTRCVFE